MVDSLDVSPQGTRVGLVQYSSRVRTEFPLSMYQTAEDIKAAVLKVGPEGPPSGVHPDPALVLVPPQVDYMEKGTMTGLALKHMLENSFSEAEGARPAQRGVPRVGLVFTDGRSQDDITEYARKAKEAGEALRNVVGQGLGQHGPPSERCWSRPAGVTMYAVGVGKAVEEELRQIASDPVDKHFYYTADFTAISNIAENLKLNVCPGTSLT